GCAAIVLAGTQQPGVQIDCGQKTVSALTDQAGSVTFIIAGSAANRGALASGAGCAPVRAGSPPVVVRQLSVAAFDQDGVNGVNALDEALWRDDFASGQYRARSDYDHNGIIGAPD